MGTVSPARSDSLTLATYNVENYGPADRMTAEGFRPGYPKPEAEKDALRAAIRALGADLLALQEMGPAPYLEELRRDLRREGLDYPYAAVLEAEDGARHLAVLSRRPFAAVVRHEALPITLRGGAERVKRGLLEVRLAAEGGLAVFAVHLKSRLTEAAEDPEGSERRAAEAAAVRDCVRREFPDPAAARYVILGDCNDGPSSPALRRLTEAGRIRIAWALPAADSRGETWTEAWRRAGLYSEFDYILVSPALRACVRGGAARIYDGPETTRASDHRPVVAVLELTSPRP
ncbi:MAG TPA: endonuclease/exonuclease/phosphatase family protein [Opitutaceae bacterium]|jgi:endonuclease/exonuclease/phosphatase family metal-dependent hydrolase|nr:endonuclease/exonuclease/phosphatase family protein [Opitutaceae bacterium]